jgi:hypothetical protein
MIRQLTRLPSSFCRHKTHNTWLHACIDIIVTGSLLGVVQSPWIDSLIHCNSVCRDISKKNKNENDNSSCLKIFGEMFIHYYCVLQLFLINTTSYWIMLQTVLQLVIFFYGEASCHFEKEQLVLVQTTRTIEQAGGGSSSSPPSSSSRALKINLKHPLSFVFFLVTCLHRHTVR